MIATKGGQTPDLGDAPNGPAALLALANSGPQSEIGVFANTSAVSITSSTTIAATKSATLVIGHIYKISGYFHGTQASATGNLSVSIFGPTGMVGDGQMSLGSLTAGQQSFGDSFTYYIASASGAQVFSVAGAVTAGSFGIPIGRAIILIEDLGLAV